jgi:hypothetical protein
MPNFETMAGRSASSHPIVWDNLFIQSPVTSGRPYHYLVGIEFQLVKTDNSSRKIEVRIIMKPVASASALQGQILQ